jgi:nucleoside-diphosphate-sugar epimerase
MTGTALVTGGAGFIGGWLTQRLAAEGWRVVVIDDMRSSPLPLELLLPDWTASGGTIEMLEADVLEYGQAPCFPDVVFHCAGPVGPLGVLSQGGRIVQQIVQLADRVARWARGHDVPLVFVATSESYGANGECHETTPRMFPTGHSARQEYAIAKLAAEEMLLNTAGLDVRIVRPFNVAGPRQSGVGGFVTPRWVAEAMAGLPLTVHQPGTQLRAFTHVADEVDGIIRAYTHGHAGLTVNLGNVGNRTDMLAYAQLVNDVVRPGQPNSVRIVDPRTLHGPGYREAVDKYPAPSQHAAAIGWYPFRDLRAIVQDTYLYMQKPGMAKVLGGIA